MSAHLPVAVAAVEMARAGARNPAPAIAVVSPVSKVLELDLLLDAIPGLITMKEQILEKAKEKLTKELKSDKKMRDKFGTKWASAETKQKSMELHSNLRSHLADIRKSKELVATVRKNLMTNREQIHQLHRMELGLVTMSATREERARAAYAKIKNDIEVCHKYDHDTSGVFEFFLGEVEKFYAAHKAERKRVKQQSSRRALFFARVKEVFRTHK